MNEFLKNLNAQVQDTIVCKACAYKIINFDEEEFVW